MIYGVECFF